MAASIPSSHPKVGDSYTTPVDVADAAACHSSTIFESGSMAVANR